MQSFSPSGRVDVQSFIDDRPISAYQWFLVAMCFLVVVADGMDVAIMGFVTPSILQEWNISRPAFGLVISAAPFGLVIGALVAGPSSDRFGRKIVLTVSVLLFGIFTLLAAYASSPTERFGSILGSAVGGVLLGSGWGVSAILALLTIPAACAAVAILMTQLGSAGVATKEAAAH